MASTKLQFVQGTPSVLTTFTHNTPKSIRMFLAVLSLAAFLMPIMVTIYLLTSDGEIKFGLFISYFILWSVGYYLLRIILWNTFGKEIMTFEDRKITYYCDYKYFLANKKEINTDQLQIEIIKSGEQDEFGVLCFTNVDEKIEMVVPLLLIDLIPVEKQIKTSYTKPEIFI